MSGKSSNGKKTGSKEEGDAASKQSPEICYEKVVLKEMNAIPARARTQFQVSLTMALMGLPPALDHEKLKSAGEGIIELKVRGRPTFRCMYAIAKNGDVVVLHVTDKATSGQDKHLIETTSKRFKRLMKNR